MNTAAGRVQCRHLNCCSHCQKLTPEVSAFMKLSTSHDIIPERTIAVVGCRMRLRAWPASMDVFFGLL